MNSFIEGGYTGNVSKTPLPVGKTFLTIGGRTYSNVEVTRLPGSISYDVDLDSQIDPHVIKSMDVANKDAHDALACALFSVGAIGRTHAAETADGNASDSLTHEKLIRFRDMLKDQQNNSPVGIFVSAEAHYRLLNDESVSILPGLPIEVDPELQGSQVAVCYSHTAWTKRRWEIAQCNAKSAMRMTCDFVLTTREARKFADLFKPKASDAYNAGSVYPERVQRNLAKLRRRSAKAAAYQARRYVAKTVKRMRRKDRMAKAAKQIMADASAANVPGDGGRAFVGALATGIAKWAASEAAKFVCSNLKPKTK